ncbi:hypothetical protein SGRIM128S_02975 [Streptomyces griseomycini]
MHQRLVGQAGVGGTGEGEVAVDRAVLDDHALGAARGAGGVDHVRDVLGPHVDGRCGPVERRQGRPYGRVAERDQGRVPGEGRVPGVGADDGGGLGVVEHEGDALGGVAGVDRHVPGAGLQRGDQRHDQVGTARQGDGHQVAAGDAPFGQEPGQPAGLLVQSAVGEGALGVGHGRGVRGGPRLFREPPGQRGGFGDLSGAAAPCAEHPPVFLGGQQGQPGDGGRGVLREGVEQQAQAGADQLHAVVVEQVPAVAEVEAQPGACEGDDAERVVGGAGDLLPAGGVRALGGPGAPLLLPGPGVPCPLPGLQQGGDAQAGDGVAQGVPAQGRVAEAGRGVEQRAVAGQAPHVGQPEVLVRGEGELFVLDPGEERGQRFPGIDPYPDGDGVHQQADDPVGAGQTGRAAVHGLPEHHVVAPGEQGQQQRPDALDDGVEGEAVPARGPLQRAAGVLGQRDADQSGKRSVAGLGGAGCDECRLGQAGQRLAPGPLGGGPVLPGQPAQVVGEGGEGSAGDGAAACGVVVVPGEQVLQHQRHRPAVQQDVVVGQHERVPVRGEPDEREPDQRRVRHVEAPPPLLLQEGDQLLDAYGLLVPREVERGPGRGRGAADQLHGLPAGALAEAGPQRGVPGERVRARGPERVGVDPAGQLEGGLHGVDVRALGVVQGVEEHALLERGEGQCGLDRRRGGARRRPAVVRGGVGLHCEVFPEAVGGACGDALARAGFGRWIGEDGNAWTWTWSWACGSRGPTR